MKPSLIHKFGGTDVRLCDRIGIEKTLLNKVFSQSGLDEKVLLLVLDDINTGCCGPGKNRAVAFPSCVLDNNKITGYDSSANVTRIDPFVWLRQRIPVGDLYQRAKWDAVVYMPRVSAERAKLHAPYFVCFLAHELEHVRIMRENLQLNMCLSWLYDYNCQIFSCARLSAPMGKTWNFPHENQCHRKGKATALSIFKESDFVQCLCDLKKIETFEHKKVLDFLLSLQKKPYERDISNLIVKDIQIYYKGIESAVYEVRKKCTDLDFELSDFLPNPLGHLST